MTNSQLWLEIDRLPWLEKLRLLVRLALALLGWRDRSLDPPSAAQGSIAPANLLDLAGKIQFRDDYDYKALRQLDRDLS